MEDVSNGRKLIKVENIIDDLNQSSIFMQYGSWFFEDMNTMAEIRVVNNKLKVQLLGQQQPMLNDMKLNK